MSNFKLNAPPKIYQLGSRYTKQVFEDEVIIEEKVDGSQFSFCKYNDELHMRSKRVRLYDAESSGDFKHIVQYLLDNIDKIPENICFYGEYLGKPRQNTLKYDRVPKNYLVIFGGKYVDTDEWISSRTVLYAYADFMGFEIVPLLFKGKILKFNKKLDEFLNRESFLGGPQIEGFVVKNYHKQYQFANLTIPFLSAKYVREEFKEINDTNHKKNFNKKSKYEYIKESYRTEARWDKAIQYLRDAGELTGDVKDIGPLICRIGKDIIEEESENIKEQLYNLYIKEITRTATHGFPEYYKKKLMENIDND